MKAKSPIILEKLIDIRNSWPELPQAEACGVSRTIPPLPQFISNLKDGAFLLIHRKGNGQGTKMRGRLNRWSFHELQRQIEYKAKWEGSPVEYVRASMTSKTCSRCGYRNKALEAEKCWVCPNCGTQHDRDHNAALDILSRFKEPSLVRSVDEGLADEAMVLPNAISKN